ncbi:hypothetical protein MHTCC0001_21910 [Flavobacteriaceae bacterium MHTCC 0001]
MNKLKLLIFLILASSINLGFSQENNKVLDAPKGLRIIRDGKDYIVYADKNFEPNFDDFRKINYRVYFRKLDYPIKEKNGKKYQLITIPGSSKTENQETISILADGTTFYPRAGKTISRSDFDQNFWIELDIIEEKTSTEYFRYANDIFSGLLTAPFKYRLKVGSAPESLIDGDFNIAPFIGWKWRTSSTRPFYVAPFGFAGVTSLDFNSANNDKITESDKLENGTGLTYGLGLSFKFGDISPGFIIGWDKGFGDLGSGFKYNDKPWISFSVNYDFFKPKADESSTGN